MAFNDELNADIPLQGITTTHPTLAETPDQAQTSAIDNQNTLARTGLIQTQNQGLAQQNQIQQQQLLAAQQYSQAVMRVARGTINGGQPAAAATATNAGTTSPDTSSYPGIAAPATSTSGSSPQAAGITPVVPTGVDPNWQVDKNHDWYVDSSGAPVSFAAGPALRPSGRPNTMSNSFIDAVADDMEAHGATPMTIIQMRQQALENAQKMDTNAADVNEKVQTAIKAQADAQDASTKAQSAKRDLQNNLLYDITNSANPIGALAVYQSQHPQAFASIMQAAAVDPKTGQPGQPITSPTDPRLLNYIQSQASNSPAYRDAQKVSSEGYHFQSITDPLTGQQSVRVFRETPTGLADITPGGSGGSAGGGSSDSVFQSTVKGLANYSINPTQVPIRARAGLIAGAQALDPSYDPGSFPVRQAAQRDFLTGVDGRNATALATAYEHVDDAKSAAVALQNNDIKLLNKIGNSLGVQTGGSAVTTYNLIRDVAAGEVVKSISGPSGGGEADRRQYENHFDSSNSPDQLQTNFNAALKLMGDKAGQLQNRARAGNLSEGQLQTIFGRSYQAPGSTPQTPSSAAPLNPATGQPLAAGDKTNKGVFMGGDWTNPANYK